MLLTGVELENFASFRDHTQIEFTKPITVITGRNNAGKSNLVKALAVTGVLPSLGDHFYVGNILGQQTAVFGKTPGTFELRFQFASDLVLDHLSSDTEPASSFKKASIVVRCEEGAGRGGDFYLTVTDSEDNEFKINLQNVLSDVSRQTIQERDLHWEPNEFRRLLRYVYIFNAERSISRPVDAVNEATLAIPDGANVLQRINTLSSSRPGVFQKIQDELRSFVPEVEHILATVSQADRNSGRDGLRLRAFSKELWADIEFEWTEISTGTRHLALLLAEMIASPPRSLFIIEEPEVFLHPDSLTRLHGLMSRLVTDEGKQFILTTHSPMLMELNSEALLVVNRDQASGTSRIVALGDIEERILREHGILHAFMFTPVRPGRIAKGILIVEGPDDQLVWTRWLNASNLSDVHVIHEEGFAGALRLARYFNYLSNSGIRSVPYFLVADADNNRDDKIRQLQEAQIPGEHWHISMKKELESYLINEEALSMAFGKPVEEVAEVIARTKRSGKEGFAAIVEKLFRKADSTLKEIVASKMSPPDDLSIVPSYFHKELG